MKEGLFVYGHISSIIGETGTVAQLTLSLLDLTLASLTQPWGEGRGNIRLHRWLRVNLFRCDSECAIVSDSAIVSESEGR